jgi:hypothetical protein
MHAILQRAPDHLPGVDLIHAAEDDRMNNHPLRVPPLHGLNHHLRIDRRHHLGSRKHLGLAHITFDVALRSKVRRLNHIVIDDLDLSNAHRRKLQSNLPADGAHSDHRA